MGRAAQGGVEPGPGHVPGGPCSPNPGCSRGLKVVPAKKQAPIQGASVALLGLIPGQGEILPLPYGELQCNPNLC